MPRSPLERPVRRTASLGTRCWNRIANWFSSDSSASREWTIMTPEERSRTAADIGLSEPDVAFSIRQGHDSRDLLAHPGPRGQSRNRLFACGPARYGAGLRPLHPPDGLQGLADQGATDRRLPDLLSQPCHDRRIERTPRGMKATSHS